MYMNVKYSFFSIILKKIVIYIKREAENYDYKKSDNFKAYF